MKVYIVTSGCYSDYHIEAVFLSHKKAMLYCAVHHAPHIDIEEYDTDDENIESNEKCGYVYHWVQTTYRWGTTSGYYRIDIMTKSQYDKLSDKDKSVWLDSPDEEKAEKILHDCVAQAKYRKEMKE